MATAQVILTDPSGSHDMKIEAADGLIPGLIAYWRTQKNPRTGVAYGFVDDKPVTDDEVVRRFFGQLYTVEVRDMLEAMARAKAEVASTATYEAEMAKFPPIEFTKVI
jgi:hypothetical protein